MSQTGKTPPEQPSPTASQHGEAAGVAEPLTQRLSPPASWWIVSAVFVVSLWVAVSFYLGTAVGIAVGAASAALVALFLARSQLRVRLDESGLTAAGNHIEWQWVADVVAHDRAGTGHRLGPGADPRAHLITRPWAHGSIEIVLADPADPHPYWLVSAADAQAVARAARRWLPIN